MSIGKRLTEREKGKIDILKAENYSNRAIALKIKRSPKVVNNYVNLKDKYGLKGKRGRKSKMTSVLKKRIIRLACDNMLSSSQIKQELLLDQSTRTIQRLLSSSPSIVYSKFKSKPQITDAHKEARLLFAKSAIESHLNWSKIIWSDEKKFNLDGPDGIRYYWHDLKSEQKYLSKRAFGGGSLMIWEAFVDKKLLDLHIMEGNYNADKYIKMLEKGLLPFYKRGMTFMQDNASIHNAELTKNWLKTKKISLLEWPSNSPDLNPIENVWGFLTRAVYANGRQFKTKNELKIEVMKQWSLISTESLSIMVDSMSTRMIEVITKNGQTINY